MTVWIDNLVAARLDDNRDMKLYGFIQESDTYVILGISESIFSPPFGLMHVTDFGTEFKVCCLRPKLAQFLTLMYVKNINSTILKYFDGDEIDRNDACSLPVRFISGWNFSKSGPVHSTFVCGLFPNAYTIGHAIDIMKEIRTNKRTVRVPWSICPVMIGTSKMCAQVIPEIYLEDHQTGATPIGGILAMSGYQFYHYKCDGFDDTGWGCAYRATQLIASWWKKNFGIIDDVPNILEIQKVLAKVDNLVMGSKTWIGCIEASMVLGEISSNMIECRIVHMKDLSELKSTLQNTVKEHFISVGSPVLVGAGDFAYTITGITDEYVFIMDPHFSFCQKMNQWHNIDTFFRSNKMWSAGFINLCLSRLAN